MEDHALCESNMKTGHPLKPYTPSFLLFWVVPMRASAQNIVLKRIRVFVVILGGYRESSFPETGEPFLLRSRPPSLTTNGARVGFDSRYRTPKMCSPHDMHVSRYFWVAIGNRTRIESSTSSSVNRYTIATSSLVLSQTRAECEKRCLLIIAFFLRE